MFWFYFIFSFILRFFICLIDFYILKMNSSSVEVDFLAIQMIMLQIGHLSIIRFCLISLDHKETT